MTLDILSYAAAQKAQQNAKVANSLLPVTPGVGLWTVGADRVRLLRSIGGQKFWGVDLWKPTGLVGSVSTTGNITTGSNQLTSVANTAAANGDIITATGVPAGTTVLSGGGTATITMSANATATTTSVAVSFAHSVYQLGDSALWRVGKTVDDTSFTAAGTWTVANNTNTQTYGGSYKHNSTQGDTLTYAASSFAGGVVLRSVKAPNGGIGVVSIDGDKTRATKLPTAQNLVDQGKVASSALTTNGGYLDPTWRCTYHYDALLTDPDYPFLLADDLAAGAHTIVVTSSGITPTGSSGARCYVSGLAWWDTAWSRGTPLTTIIPTHRLFSATSNGGSAYEYAHSITVGAQANIFIGSVHGYEYQTAFSATLDGDTFDTTSVGLIRWGDDAKISRTTVLRHPGLGSGATDFATVVTTYRLYGAGLRIKHRTAWAQNGTVIQSWPAMWPTDARVFTTGKVGDTTVTLGLADGTYAGQLPVDNITLNAPTPAVTAFLKVQDVGLSVDNYAQGAPRKAAIENRLVASGQYHKAYITKVDTPDGGSLSVTSASVFEGDTLYTVSAA